MAEKVSVVIEVDSSGAVTAFKSAGEAAEQFGQNASNASGSVENVGRAAKSAESGISGIGSAAKTASAGLGSIGAAAKESDGAFGRFSAGIDKVNDTLERVRGAYEGLAEKVRRANEYIELARSAFELVSSAAERFFSGIERADSLNDLSQKVGVTVETLSAFELSATTAGTTIEGLGVGFKDLSKNLADAASGNTQLASAFTSVLGPSFDLSAGLADVNGTMLKLSDAFADMEDGGRKTALAMKVFGEAGLALLPWLNQGSAEIERFTEISRRLGAVITDDVAQAADMFGDNLAVLGTAAQGVQTQLSAGMLPAMVALTDVIVDLATKTSDGQSTFESFGASIGDAVLRGTGKALGALASFIDDVNQLGIGRALVNVMGAAFTTVVDLAVIAGKRIGAAILGSVAEVAAGLSGLGAAFDYVTGASDSAAKASGRLNDEADRLQANLDRPTSNMGLESLASNLRSASDRMVTLADDLRETRAATEASAQSCEVLSEGLESVGEMSSMTTAQQKALEQQLAANQSRLSQFTASLQQLTTVAQAQASMYQTIADAPVGSAAEQAAKREQEIFTQLLETMKDVGAVRASMAAQDEAYKSAAAAVDAARSSATQQYRVDLQASTQAQYDHISAMKIAAEQYGLSGQAQSAVASIIEQTSQKILALGAGHEAEAAALRASAEERIRAEMAGQAYSDGLAKQAENQKAAEEATTKNSEAVTQHAESLTLLSGAGQMWAYAAEGATSYAEAERAAIAVTSASNDILDKSEAVRLRVAEVMQEQTNETLKSAAAMVESNGAIQAEISTLDAAVASGLSYVDAQYETQKALILREAEQAKAKDATTAEAQALNASIDILARTKLENLELARAKEISAKAGQNTDTIRMLKLELDLNKQVAAGIITKTQAERQMAVAAAGTNETLQEQAGQIFDLTKEVEDAKDSFVGIGDILTGAFDQAFDAVISGTRDLGDALEGIALSIGKQIFSNMLDAKFNDFDPTMKKNFLDLGSFGSGVFGKMFSGVVDLGKSIFSGSGDAGGGFFSSIGGLFGGNTGGTTVSPNMGGGAGGFMKMLGSGFSGLGSTVLKGLTGLGSTIGGFLGLGGGGAAAGAQVVGMTSAAAATEAVATGATAAASGLSAVAAAVSAVLPIIAALGVAIMLLLPAIKKWLDTTTEGTKVRMEGEGILNTSSTFGKDSDLQNRLGPFTRGYDNLRNMEGGGGYSAQGPVYQVGRERASERFVAGGMSEEDARRASDAIAGGGTALFTKLFSKGKSDSQMVNGAKDLGNMMAEFLSRGLAEGMTYEDMIASMREFADEAGVTFEVAIESVAKFGDAAAGVWQDGITGPTEFARSMYGVIEIFKSDFPAGVNIGQAALEAMSADGVSAFANLDGATRDWLNQVGQSPEALQAALATLNAQGFNIDTEAFMNALEDLSRSAQAVAPGIAQIFTGAPVMSAIKTMTDTVKNDVMAAFQEVGTQDLFDSTRITQSFQPVYALIRQLKDGAFDISSEGGMDSFMQQLVTATAEGKANLDQYIPQMKAMKAAAEEVQKALDEAFKPTAAEELAAATEAMAAGLKQSFGGGIAAAMDAALAEGGDRAAGLAAFGESMRGSIKDSVKNSIIQGMVEAAMMQGPLAEMMATFGQAFKAAVQGGITSEEQAMLNAYLGQMGQVADQTIAYLQPSVDAVLQLGEAADTTFGKLNGGTVGVPTDPALAQFKKDVEEAQATLKSGFSSAVSEAFSMIGQGKSVEEATAAFSESFKSSISASVSQGLQEALVQSAVMEGALGTMMAEFKTMTAAAMADGVITGAEQAQLAGMAQQIKTTGEAAANALAPVVASVATIATGVASGTDSVSFAVNTNAEASAAAADATISNSATVASETVSAATTSAADTVTTAVAQAGDATAAAATSGAATTTAAYADAATLASDALNTAGTSLSTDVQAATDNAKTAIEAILGTGDQISQMAPEAAYGIGQSLADVRDKVAPEMQAQIDALIGSLADASLSPEESERLQQVLGSVGGLGDALPPDMAAQAQAAFEAVGAIGQALTPDMAAQANAVISAVGTIGDGIDPATIASTQQALSSLATLGADVDPAGMEQFSAVTAALAEGSAALGDPGAVVDTMKALGDAALSSGDAANLAGTMKALGAAALDSGTAADMGATIKAFSAASAEGASNTTAIIDAFSAIDAGTSGKVQESLTALVSNGVAEGAAALSETLGGEGPDAIVSGLETLQAQLDAGTLSSLTDPLNDALGSVVSPADSIRSALDRLKDPTREVTDDMSSLGDAVSAAVSAINSAASSVRAGSPVPGAATGGAFSSGSAVVGEAGKPELVTANQGGGFTVTPLSWSAADSLMSGGTPGLAMGGIVGGGTGGIGGGGGGLPAPPPRGGGYTPGAEGAEFADFTSAIVEAFRAGLEGSKGFIEDFSDAINESVRTRLIDAIMQGFAEGPAIQGYADAIDGLITKAQTLAGNNQLTAEELANIQAQIKTNTDAIGAQADAIDELLEPMRQAEAISTAISDGLDFSGALKSLALNPDDLEGFRRSIDQTVNEAVLNGAIQGLLASGPIQDAIKSFGDEMNTAMAAALEDGVITAEESDALHNLAVTGSEEMKTAMEALGPVLSALGIDLGDSLSEGVNRAKEMMQSASSAMDPFAGLGEGETQFGNFTQNIRDQVYGNIRDGLVQAFIDSAVTQGLLAGPMMAIQGIFDQIGQKQLTTAEANAKIAEQVGIINGSLNDPAFKSAFDSTMASIQSIGSQLRQTTQTVERATTTATRAVDTTQDVCKTGCELQARTRSLGDTAVNNFGRAAGISIEDFVPKMALGGLVKKPTIAMVGEAGPELVIPTAELAAAASAIERVNFDAARNSATEGIEALLGSMPAMFTDAISSQMGADAAMAQKLKEAAAGMSAGPGTIDPSAIAAAIAAVPSSAAGMSGAGAPSPAIDEMAEKLAAQSKATGEDTVTAIEDLRVAMDDIARALADQPAQTDIKIDGEVLVRAMSKARRLARKAGVEV